MIKRILGITLLIMAGVCSQALNISDIIPLQKDLENKAQNILDKYLGPNNAIANVIITLKKENVTTVMSTNEENKTNNKAVTDKDGGEIPEESGKLPGYSLLANKQKVYDTISSVAKTTTQVNVDREIDRIEVSLVVDKKVPQSSIDNVEPIIKEVLRLDDTRGDNINTLTLDLYTEKKESLKLETFKQRLSSTLRTADFIKLYVIYIMIFIVLVIVGVVVMISIFIYSRSTRKIQQEVISDQSTTIKKDNVEDSGDVLNEIAGSGKTVQTTISNAHGSFDLIKADGSDKPLFYFVTPTNIGKLAYLIKDETSDKKIAALNFLKPDLAARLLESFPLEVQKKLVLLLNNETKLSPEEIKAFEKDVEYNIDFLAGGRNYTKQLFDYMNQDISRSILKEIEKEDNVLAAEISNNIYDFEDIQYLEKRYVQYIVRTVGVKDFSVAVNDETEQFLETIYGLLSEGVTELIKQSLKLLQKQPKTKISEAQFKVTQVMKTLNREGLIPGKSELFKLDKETEL